MRSDRPPYREIVDSVGHNRIGVTVSRKQSVPHTNSVIERGELRQPVMPVTVFFFEAPRAPLETGAGTGIETAVVSRASGPKAVEKRAIGGATDGVDPEGDRCRVRNPLVRKTCPPTFGSDVIGDRIGPPHPSKLRIRLGAYQGHGQRCASA